jgi:hypothetical protein
MADLASVTSQFKGPRTSIFSGTQTGATDTITNAQLLSMAATSGALFDFLNTTTFANDAAVEAAFGALAGEIAIRSVSGTAVTGFAWKGAGGGAKPTAALLGGGAGAVVNLAIRLNHSVIQ